jgi:hypothetical protein
MEGGEIMDNEKMKELLKLLLQYKDDVVYYGLREYSKTYIQGQDDYIPSSSLDVLAPYYKEIACIDYLTSSLLGILKEG